MKPRVLTRGESLVLIGCFIVISSASADTATWDGGGGDNNWNTPSNWALDSVPVIGQDVVLDSASNITITASAAASINSLTISNGANLYLDNSLTVTNLLLIKGSSSLRCNSQPVSCSSLSNQGTLTSSGATISCSNLVTSGTYTASGATTISVSGSVNIGGTFTHNNSTALYLSGDSPFWTTQALNSVYIVSGTRALNTTLTLSGGLTVASGAVLDEAGNNITVTGNVLLNGGTLINTGSVLKCADFISTGTYTNSGTAIISASGNVSIAGTFNHNSATTLYMYGTKNLGSTVPLYALEVPSGTVTLTTNLSLANNLTVGAGGTLNLGSNNISITGNIANSGTLNIATGSLNCADFNTTNVFAATGTALLTASGDVTISGTFTHNNSTTLCMTGNKTLSSGKPLYNLSILSGTASAATVLSIANNLTISSGATLDIGNWNLIVAGSLNSDGTLAVNTATIRTTDLTLYGTFTATGSTVISTFGNVVLNGTFTHNDSTLIAATGPKTFATGVQIFNLSVAGSNITLTSSLDNKNNLNLANTGNLFTNGNTVTVGGNITTAGGSYNFAGSTINVKGNYDVGATVCTYTGSTIVFTGSTNQTVTNTGVAFNNLTIANLGAPGKVTPASAISLTGNLLISSGALDLATNDPAFTFGGNFTINGTGDILKGAAGAAGALNFQGASPKVLSANGKNIGDLSTSGSTITVNSNVTVDDLYINFNTAVRMDASATPVTLSVTDGKTITNAGNFIIGNADNEVMLRATTGVSPAVFYGGPAIILNGYQVSLKNIDMQANVTAGVNEGVNLKGNTTFHGANFGSGSVFNLGTNCNATFTTGNININSTCNFTKGAGTGKLIFTATGTQNLTVGGNIDLGNVDIDNNTDLVFKNTATMENVHIFSGSTLSLSSTSATIPATLSIYNGGVINNEGVFRVVNSTGTVTLQSLGTSTLVGNSVHLSSFKLTISGIIFSADFFVDANSWLTMTGTCTFSNIASTANTSRIYQGNNNDLYVKGNLTLVTNTFYKDGGTGSVIFSGGGAQNLSSTNTSNLTNNLGRVLLTGSSTVSVVNNLILDSLNVTSGSTLLFNRAGGILKFVTAGATITNAGTIQLASATTHITIDSSGNTLTINSTGTTALTGVKLTNCNASSGNVIDATQNCINGGNNLNITFLPITWTGTVNSVFNNGANWSSLSVPVFDDSVVFNGATPGCNIDGISITVSRLTLNGTTLTINNSGLLVNGDITINGGTLLDGGGSIVTCKGNWIKTGGTYTAGGSVIMNASSGTKVLTTGASPFYNLILNDGGGSATFRVDDSLTVNNDLTITDGILNLNGKPSVFGGSFNNNGGSFATGGSTVTFAAASGVKTIRSGGSTYNSIVFNDGGGSASFVLADSINALADISINGGTLSTGANPITVKGNFTVADTLSSGTGTVYFNKNGAQTITGGTGAFNNIVISNNTNLSTTTNFAFKNLNVESGSFFQCTADGATLTATTGGTINVAGSIILVGGASKISLFSSSLGTKFYINKTGSVNFSGLNIRDCDASSGLPIDVSTNNCSNFGGNSNFTFAAAIWDGGGADGYFSTAANWNSDVVPQNNDNIFFNSGSANCTINADTAMGNLTLGGYTGTLTVSSGRVLTVTGSTVVTAGTLKLESGRIKINSSFNPPSGKFIMNGTSVLEMSSSGDLYSNGNAFKNLVLSGSGTSVRVRDSLSTSSITISTGTELKCLDNNITLTNAAGGTVLVNGTLTLAADAGRQIKLRSGTASTLFKLTVNGASSIAGVDFKDCDASAGISIGADDTCIDSGNNRNINFNIMTVMANVGGEIISPADTLTKFSIPTAALPKDCKVTISTLAVPAGQGIGFRISATGFADGQAVTEMAVPATITIHYPAVFAGVTAGTYTDLDVALFYHNGVEWVKLGGVINASNKTISIKTSRFGQYKAKASLRATAFALNQVVPKKNFTPNGDGINDEIRFYIENPKDNAVIAKIYNLAGDDLIDLPLETSGTYYYWNGKDRSGLPQSSGIYIYQFKVEGKISNGTVVLSK